MSFPMMLACFKTLGDRIPLQVIHAMYGDNVIDDGGWNFSKTASVKIADLNRRGLIKISEEDSLYVASLDWSVVEMMSTVSGEKLAFDDAELSGRMFKIAADVADAAATADAAVPAEQPKFDPQEEMNLLKSWKTTGDNKHLSELLTRYTPLIKKNSRAFYGADVPKPAIDAEAKQVAIQAFTNFDPTRGVKLSTYVSSYMPKIRRYVIKHQNPVRISEDLSMRVGRYRQSEDELTQKLGRAPAAQEVADHNSWSLRDVRKIRMAAQGANLNETADFVPAQESGERKAMIFIDYLYHELDGEQKKVLEHLYGLHGAQKAETSEKISELSGFPVGRVNRLRSQISEKMQANLGQT